MLAQVNYTMNVKQFRPIVDDNTPAAVRPDTYEECMQKIALFEIRQRALSAGVATCMLECMS